MCVVLNLMRLSDSIYRHAFLFVYNGPRKGKTCASLVVISLDYGVKLCWEEFWWNHFSKVTYVWDVLEFIVDNALLD